MTQFVLLLNAIRGDVASVPDPGAVMEACLRGFGGGFLATICLRNVCLFIYIFLNLIEGIFEILKFWCGRI